MSSRLRRVNHRRSAMPSLSKTIAVPLHGEPPVIAIVPVCFAGFLLFGNDRSVTSGESQVICPIKYTGS